MSYPLKPRVPNSFTCFANSGLYMVQDPGCLKAGPWSVKTFDVLSRISARIIISGTK